MSSPNDPPQGHKFLALWLTVIIEGLMIVGAGAYNIYEIRRNSELVQKKIQGLSDFSARQGEKVDRMLTAFELSMGKKLTSDEAGKPSTPATDQRLDKAIELLEGWKKKEAKAENKPTQ